MLLSNIIEPNFATMSMSEIWNFNGALISTDVSTSLSMNKCFAPKAKYFYVWDLEWIRNRLVENMKKLYKLFRMKKQRANSKE